MSESIIVEIGGEPAGIVFKEGNAFRFHATQPCSAVSSAATLQEQTSFELPTNLARLPAATARYGRRRCPGSEFFLAGHQLKKMLPMCAAEWRVVIAAPASSCDADRHKPRGNHAGLCDR